MNLQYTLSKAVAVALITGIILLSGFLASFLIGCQPRGGVAPTVATVLPVVIDIDAPGGGGSGVVVDRRGYIVTCWHVVEHTTFIGVCIGTVEGQAADPWEAKLIAKDEKLDLALIKVDHGFPTAVTWGNSATLRIGDFVFAVGYPFDIAELVSYGYISQTALFVEQPVLVTDATVNHGNSGGGLFDSRGALVGIPNAYRACPDGFGGNVGISLAIPSNTAHLFVLRNLP